MATLVWEAVTEDIPATLQALLQNSEEVVRAADPEGGGGYVYRIIAKNKQHRTVGTFFITP